MGLVRKHPIVGYYCIIQEQNAAHRSLFAISMMIYHQLYRDTSGINQLLCDTILPIPLNRYFVLCYKYWVSRKHTFVCREHTHYY